MDQCIRYVRRVPIEIDAGVPDEVFGGLKRNNAPVPASTIAAMMTNTTTIILMAAGSFLCHSS